jgi:hypothetical protein
MATSELIGSGDPFASVDEQRLHLDGLPTVIADSQVFASRTLVVTAQTGSSLRQLLFLPRHLSL